MNNATSRLRSALAALLALACALPATRAQTSTPELDAFIAEETASEDSDSLLPSDRRIDGAFFDEMSLLETPRAVLSLSPEAMKQFQIRDFSDLEKVGAGTERYNFYGIAGAPVIRGWQGGTYFNGMMRAFQRNEMPTSFGSLEALDIVKGPAPAQFVPSHVGGYANMVPKSPYFDAARGSLQVTVGSHAMFNVQVDAGAPTLLFGKPSAYRISVTAQQAGSYYDRIKNDYFSIYGAVKSKLSESIRLFTGGEYFQFKSNENAGWNRPTQNLIDNGEYVIGEPLSLVRSGNGGVAERGLIDGTVFDFGPIPAANRALFRALVVPESVISSAVAAGTITAAQRNLLVNMGDAATRSAVYAGLPADIAPTTSGYVYTPAYFQAGGTVFTAPIEGSTVLSDEADFADSEDFIYFLDLIGTPSGGTSWKSQFLFEKLKTDKLSSYGYGIQTDQLVLDQRATLTNTFALGDAASLRLSYGAQIRYSEATQLQDFWTEPFARRDISTGLISANSVILAGGQVDPLTGDNYWGGGFGAGGPGGHAAESDTLQLAAFAVGSVTAFEDRFSLLFGLRGERADFETRVPSGPTDIAANRLEGDIDFFNFSLNPNLRITEDVSLYAVYQDATTFVPVQGGAVLGEGNFGQAELFEVGAKVSLLENKLFATAAYYEWEQSNFNDRSAVSDQFESEGFELEVTYQPIPALTFIGSLTARETRKISTLGFRTMPFSSVDPTGAGDDEIGVALESGGLLNQFSAAFGGFTPEGARPSGNPERIVPGSPETIVKLFGIYRHESGFGASLGLIVRDGYFHNYDRTLTVDDSLVANASLFYRAEKWEVSLGIENLTDEDYFVGADPEFAANTLITKGEERRYDLTFSYRF